MNKHTKLALFVAPLLAVIGWIGSDMWLASQSPKDQFYALQAEADYCDITAKNCILQAGKLRLSVYLEGEKTVVNATLPLDDATLFVVDEQNVIPYRLGILSTPYYWYQHTSLNERLATQGSQTTFRIIATYQSNKYAGEFVSTTLGQSILRSGMK